ncbi:MAG: hypothetical protein KDB61_02300 [Planctomycetes bacterium]|nr:hypothetical protein [Planctomycetota bacterium]
MENDRGPNSQAIRWNHALLRLAALPVLAASVFATGGVLQDEGDQDGAATEGEQVAADKASGYVNFRWRSRWTADGDDDDTDLYGVVGVDYESTDWSVHVLGRSSWSVTDQEPGSVFYSEKDTHSDLDGDLYHAYVDFKTGEDWNLARVGRLLIYETPETVHFDGAQFETAPEGPTQVRFGGYGGSSVHLSEDWPSDEWLAGVYTTFRPWEQGTMRFDFMHFVDDARMGEGENDLLTLGVVHRPKDNLRVEGQYSLLDGDSRDMRVRGFAVLPDQQLTVRASYFQQFERELNYASELNPYYNFLNAVEPYNQGQVTFTKVFDDSVSLAGGFDSRRVDEQADIGRFNRDFDRYFLTASMIDLLPMDTTLGLTGEVWDSPQNDISTWGVDLKSHLEDGAEASVGSYYSLYKYYLDSDAEREDVRTYYGEYRRELSEAASFKVRYEYEDESADSFHSIKVSVLWRF